MEIEAHTTSHLNATRDRIATFPDAIDVPTALILKRDKDAWIKRAQSLPHAGGFQHRRIDGFAATLAAIHAPWGCEVRQIVT